MGTLLGHGSTGSFFFLCGLIIFLRSLGVSYLRGMRTNKYLLSFQGMGFLIGGIIYEIGELSVMVLTGDNWGMGHLQHTIMAASFSLTGLVLLLHMHRVLTGVGWAFIPSFEWLALATLFYFHEQHKEYTQFGHHVMTTLFLCLFFLTTLDVIISFYSNPNYHRRVTELQDMKDLGKNVSVSTVHPMYTNPIIYGTPLPYVIGLVLMVVGTWDWDMAIYFAKGSPELEMGDMKAESNFLIHCLANIILTIFITVILKRIDKIVYLNSNSNFVTRDENIWFATASQIKHENGNDNWTVNTNDIIKNMTSSSSSSETPSYIVSDNPIELQILTDDEHID
eukprot:TRINITY_DN524_c0_g1_i1.p1 TRINITY_DN524_c0_g1~~TRINITY_DN524_c0_g1_i1.p1  ORF type:complete len:337 (+),score=71.54 TRINITY_DN524_c0_g1_i1:64-1074(+)